MFNLINRLILLLSGRCTHGYELRLNDGSCPTFQKTSNSTSNSTSTAAPDATAVICSILTRAGGKELCLDIAGENPSYGTPLLGYDCTGRWNQLFHLGANCTITAEQPAVVGRVRGNGGGSGDSGESVTLCLDVHHNSGVVVTAPCGHLASSGAEQSTVDVNNAGEAVGNSPEDINSKVKAASTDQQFQFITADGKAFQDYLKR